jgi:hypothetical protein
MDGLTAGIMGDGHTDNRQRSIDMDIWAGNIWTDGHMSNKQTDNKETERFI